MPLIQNPGPGRKLQRGLRLTELPDSILAPELVGVILVEDLSAPLSDEERGCMAAGGAGAVAAEFSLLALVRVGAPAQYDLTVTSMHFSSTTAQQIRLIVPTAGIVGLAASANTQFKDFNTPGRPTSQFGIDTQVAVPAGRVLLRYEIEASVTYRVKLQIRLGTFGIGPQLSSLIMVAMTANTLLLGGWEWTESAPQG